MKKSETKLLKQFRTLSEEAQFSVIQFCDFLSSQQASTAQDIAEPDIIPRPENESVVLAMRRLSKTYFMLDNDSILHEASSLMSQHVLQGREASEVIDQLEILFKKQYNALLSENGNNPDRLNDD